MKKDFREFEKEQINTGIPVDIMTAVREQAARQRSSISRLISEALCNHVGLKPSEYGIEADRQTA